LWNIENKGIEIIDFIKRIVLGWYIEYQRDGNGWKLERVIDWRVDYWWLCQEWIISKSIGSHKWFRK